jgi:5,10-methylenetetrahydromethanopterin reductase
MEFWTATVAAPTRSAEFALEAEDRGWDGMNVVDSQNLSGDPYVCLAMAATTTRTLRLATSVTNPVTRHPATTASSALSVQRVSRGRMVLGIGRGDSALAHLGRAPARLGWFEDYLVNLQAYLRGEEVDFENTGIPDDAAPLAEKLGLAHGPAASSLRWIGEGPKVPVEVAATGPKVIGIAARQADRVMLAVGADPKRVAWGIETARGAAAEAGRDPASLQFGAYVNVVCCDDARVGRELGRASTGLFARFSVMYGEIAGPADEQQADVFHKLHDSYDMTAHGREGGQQTAALTDEFIDSYAIIGGPEHCAARIEALLELGIDKFAVTGPNFASPSPPAREAAERFTNDVLPLMQG